MDKFPNMASVGWLLKVSMIVRIKSTKHTSIGEGFRTVGHAILGFSGLESLRN